MKICIDPGHGQHDPGAIGPGGTKEKDVALAMALKVGEKLKYNGFDIVYTRTNDNPGFSRDQRQNLAKRVSIANTAKADLFISIHCNSATNRTANGTETWIVGRGGEAEKLANAVQDGLVKATGLTNRGIKVANFHVLKYTQMPAILIETAFISNPSEEKLLRDSEFQDKIATAITRGVCKYAGIEYKEEAKKVDITPTKVIVSGKEYDAYIIDGKTYVEVRGPFEATGFFVHWNSKTKKTEIRRVK